MTRFVASSSASVVASQMHCADKLDNAISHVLATNGHEQCEHDHDTTGGERGN